jgi:hypothetical protein
VRAVVSGQAGIALLWDGNHLSSLHVGVDGPPVPRRPWEIPFLLGDINDLEVIEDAEQHHVSPALARASDKADSLHLALILLDGTLSVDTRREASLELEELLGGPGIREHLEKIFYALPLPAEADLIGALDHRAEPTSEVDSFLRNLGVLQGPIAGVAAAWRKNPSEVLDSLKKLKSPLTAVQSGLIRELVISRANAEKHVPIGLTQEDDPLGGMVRASFPAFALEGFHWSLRRDFHFHSLQAYQLEGVADLNALQIRMRSLLWAQDEGKSFLGPLALNLDQDAADEAHSTKLFLEAGKIFKKTKKKKKSKKRKDKKKKKSPGK